jgi:phytoene dehydrogenase-like protein
MEKSWDAVVVGSGPNGLGAAIVLAEAGHRVLVVEGYARPGGGMRTEELTLPGFQHDVCSAIHPTGILSPLFRRLPLERYGLKWAHPAASVAHPFDGGGAALLVRSLSETCDRLGPDGAAYRRLVGPFVDAVPELMEDLLAPLRLPKRPLRMAQFGISALRSCEGLARGRFRTAEARALFAGCAAHSILPLDFWTTAALGLVFCVSAHAVDWPAIVGGSERLAQALVQHFKALGGEVRTGTWVRSLRDVPAARVVLFDTSPAQLAEIAGSELPKRYLSRLARFEMGPGCFKLDFALNGPIPWANGDVAGASTVHLGGTMEEIARWERAAYEGRSADRPFVLVCQQSQFDPSRAPAGKHTGYAYAHVPHGSDEDFGARIEQQIERFAPGFGDLVLARHTMKPRWLEQHNPNYLGGAVTGGAAHIGQLFTRPVARLNPYTTPNPRLFLCSASTPPGGGVHGMCGFWAARAALRRLGRPVG